NKKTIGEFSVTYLCDENAPKRIKESYPDAKLIVSLRNPIERSFSHYQHFISKKAISDEALEEAVEKFPEIISNSLYGQALTEYLKHFDKNQILILHQEDIKEDPNKFIKKIYNFLDIDSGFEPSCINKKYHTTRSRLSPVHKKVNVLYIKLGKTALGLSIIKLLKKPG
ncbi:hypothetical protein GF340_04190, partial [Candidatus Peregrinibacteria bacterium]|nr:hypothetical protein [Candidatus Peregrinibacteria bacterium]